jgi:hypothetical protein
MGIPTSATILELYTTAVSACVSLKEAILDNESEQKVQEAAELVKQVFDNPDFGFKSHMEDESGSVLESTMALPHPLAAELYLAMLLTIFDAHDAGVMELHADEILQVMQSRELDARPNPSAGHSAPSTRRAVPEIARLRNRG